MLNNKRGQLILFVLIGMLVLGSFFFIWQGRGGAAEAQTKGELEKLTTDNINVEKVQFRVQQCLEKALDDGITLIGEQGGYIFKGQPGSIIPVEIPFVQTDRDLPTNKNTSYRIEMDVRQGVPEYPCKSVEGAPRFCKFINDVEKFSDLYSLNYGKVKPLTITGNRFSIENMLSLYVSNSTNACVNLSQFRAFNITVGTVNTTVEITNEGVYGEINFPLTIKVQDTLPVIEKTKFTSVKRVRLKKVHDAVNEIIDRDLHYVNFDIKEDSAKGQYGLWVGDKLLNRRLQIKDLNLDVKVIPNVNGNDDLIQFIDHKSKLAGRPYIFQFARQNRPPVLDLIMDEKLKSEDFEYVLKPGDVLEIKPNAHDPDEDKVEYIYEDWQSNELMNSYLFLEEGECKDRCVSLSIQKTHVGQHTIKVRASDGDLEDFQIIRIKVLDVLEAIGIVRDWNNLPVSIVSIEDPYYFDSRDSLIPEENEDDVYKHTWALKLENGKIEAIRATGPDLRVQYFNCFMVPGGKGCDKLEEIDIKNMLGQFNIVGKHELLFRLSHPDTERFDDDIFEIKVNRCIPHLNPSVPAFPYYLANDDKDNPDVSTPLKKVQAVFNADHTCCDADGDYKKGGTRNRCYGVEIVVCKKKLEQTRGDIISLLGVQPLGDAVESSGELPVLLIDKQNVKIDAEYNKCVLGKPDDQVCKITFKQYCSGKRGNACSGDTIYQAKPLEDSDGVDPMFCDNPLNMEVKTIS